MSDPQPPASQRAEAPADLARARHIHFWLSPRRWLQRLVFWGGAIAVAAAAILFAVGADKAHHLFQRLREWSPLLPLVVTPAGLALVAVLMRWFPGTQGSGIPQTIAALGVRDPGRRGALLSLRIAIGKILLTLLALLSGASVGREGPTVQIGASIMQAIGRVARFSRADVERGLILAGGAAGIAAAFNTPLAGIVFAIEEMSRSFEERTSGTILTAVIVAGIVSLAVLGDYTYFGKTSAALDITQAWLGVIVTGVLGGFAGGFFGVALIATSRSLPGELGRLRLERPVAFAAGCGFVIALIGVASGGTTFGTGYEEARRIVEGATLDWTFGVFKFFATIVSYVSGIPGGIFAPSLAIGAGFGQNLAGVLPYAPAAAVAVLGMVAFFAGVAQTPITAFVIVMEMTDNHDMVLPLMATALLASAVSRLVNREPIYRALAKRFLVQEHADRRAAQARPAGEPPPSRPGDNPH